MEIKTVEYENGKVIYSGQFINKDEYWHGHGNLKNFNEHGKLIKEYDGDFNYNKRHGKGRLTIISDIIYVYTGDWENNVQNGKCHIQYIQNGVVIKEYKGDIVENKYEGFGIIHQRRSDGSEYIYNGSWKNNMKEGIGNIQYLNKDGKVTYTYTGYMHYDNKHTKKSSKDPRETIGELLKLDEYGIPIFVYKGGWKNNRKEGPGIKNFKNGLICNGIWEDDKLISGNLLFEDVIISCTWKKGWVHTIDTIINPRNIRIELDMFMEEEIFDENSGVIINTFAMYELIGFLHTEEYIKEFLKDINDRQSSVRIVAICHGGIMPAFPLSISNLQRVSQVEHNICNYGGLQEKINLLKVQDIKQDEEYIGQVQTMFKQNLERHCDLPDEPESKLFLQMCKTLKIIPNKTFVYNQPILNKIFSISDSDGVHSNISLLLVYNDRGEYVNLFTPDRESITLQNILKRIVNCSNCILIDKSCSSQYKRIVHKQIQYMGGKRKTKRKK